LAESHRALVDSTRQAANRSTGSNPPERPSTQPPPGAGVVAPDGNDPADLLSYMAELQSRQPVGTSRDEAIADFQRTQEQLIKTADRILASEADDNTLLAAAQGKMSSFSALAQLGFDDARTRLLEFCLQLQTGGKPVLVDIGRRVSFATRLDAIASGVESDPQPMLDDFFELIKHEPKDEQLIQLGREVSSALEQTGHGEQAQQVLSALTAALNEVGDPQLLAGVQALREEGDLIAAGIRAKFAAAAQGDGAAEQAFLAASQQLLASDRRGLSTVGFLLQRAAYTLEAMKPQVAEQLYEQIRVAFVDHENTELAEFVATTIERYQKRARLVGHPFEVAGVTIEGQLFDWSEYEGKVVLIDFWATWCGPCLQELPNIRANYEKFREQGFEVVGVNLDDDPQDVQAFFSVQKLPWPTVLSTDPQTRGMKTPLAVESGVEFIPFIVLVGRDGKVAALNVRGEKLEPKLVELLNAPAESTGG
jgi:thiol-disulfide isomerase/thioredoxin